MLHIFICTILSLPYLAFAEIAPSNLILRLWGSDQKLLKARILNAAEAVGPQGKLLLDYTAADRDVKISDGQEKLLVDPKILMAELPPQFRSRIILVNSNEAYSWPRDTSMGWRIDAEKKYQLTGRPDGNLVGNLQGDTYTSYSTLGISALLTACENDRFQFPTFHSASAQGGEVVSNGDGICLVNANIEVELLKENMGCKKVISGPSTHDLRSLGLMNGHMDLSAVFVGPKTVLVPTVDKDCSSKLTLEWNKLKQSLKDKSLAIIEIPVGGGCDGKTKIASGIGSRFIRSYSNAVVLKNAIIIPEFVVENVEENIKLQKYNQQAKKILLDNMNAGKIPKRAVLGVPVTSDMVESGGEVRCMSLEVPGKIAGCTQKRLDTVLEKHAGLLLQKLENLKTNPAADNCKNIKDLNRSARFLREEPERQRIMILENGKTLQILKNKSYSAIVNAAEIIQAALEKCKGK